MPSIPHSITAPGHIHSCGLLPAPTPDGVPVAIISPGSKVIPEDKSEIRVGILKSKCFVLERCFSTPFFFKTFKALERSMAEKYRNRNKHITY